MQAGFEQEGKADEDKNSTEAAGNVEESKMEASANQDTGNTDATNEERDDTQTDQPSSDQADNSKEATDKTSWWNCAVKCKVTKLYLQGIKLPIKMCPLYTNPACQTVLSNVHFNPNFHWTTSENVNLVID